MRVAAQVTRSTLHFATTLKGSHSRIASFRAAPRTPISAQDKKGLTYSIAVRSTWGKDGIHKVEIDLTQAQQQQQQQRAHARTVQPTRPDPVNIWR